MCARPPGQLILHVCTLHLTDCIMSHAADGMLQSHLAENKRGQEGRRSLATCGGREICPWDVLPTAGGRTPASRTTYYTTITPRVLVYKVSTMYYTTIIPLGLVFEVSCRVSIINSGCSGLWPWRPARFGGPKKSLPRMWCGTLLGIATLGYM